MQQKEKFDIKRSDSHKELAKAECANFTGRNGCLQTTKPRCVFFDFQVKGICTYFNFNVLQER